MELDIYKILYSMREESFWKETLAQSFKETEAADFGTIFNDIKRIVFVGCGTSNYAGIYGKELFETFAGIPCTVVDGNSGRYIDKKMFNQDVLYIGISNTGNSGTAVETMENASRGGAKTLCITGNKESRIAKTSDAVLFFPGAADYVATKTRSYIETLVMLLALAVKAGQDRCCRDAPQRELIDREFKTCAVAAQRLFQTYDTPLEKLAQEYRNKHLFQIVGSGLNLASAYEGGLKLCEVGWTACEGMEMESFMHGKFRGTNENTPFFVLAGDDGKSFDTAVNFIAVSKQCKAECICITDRISKPINDLAKMVIQIDPVWDILKPMLYILPIYIFGMYLGIARGKENPAASQFGRPAQTIHISEFYPEYK